MFCAGGMTIIKLRIGEMVAELFAIILQCANLSVHC